MLNSTEHETFPAHKNKNMPTIVDILTFMRGKNSNLGLSECKKKEKAEFLDIFILMSI